MKAERRRQRDEFLLLGDSATSRLRDSETSRLRDSETPRLPDSETLRAPRDIIRIMDDPVGTVGIGEDADEVEADILVEDVGFVHVFLGVFLQGTNLGM